MGREECTALDHLTETHLAGHTHTRVPTDEWVLENEILDVKRIPLHRLHLVDERVLRAYLLLRDSLLLALTGLCILSS